jgi:hypothetical protein
VSEPKPEVESEVEPEVESEVEPELKLEMLPEVAASIAEQEVAIVRTAWQPTTYSGAVVRSPFKVDQVGAMVLPTDSILSGSEPNTPEQDATHVFIESVPHDVEVESHAVEVGSPAAEVGSPAAEVGSPAAEVESPAAEVESPAVEVESPAVEVESPAVEVESPAVEVESPAVEPALVHHFPDPMSVKFKPLVFLKSRSESDAPIE